jgi:hypothetical protein
VFRDRAGRTCTCSKSCRLCLTVVYWLLECNKVPLWIENPEYAIISIVYISGVHYTASGSHAALYTDFLRLSNKLYYYVRFQVLAAKSMKVRVFLDTASSGWWWRQYTPLKLRCTPTRIHGTISHKSLIFKLYYYYYSFLYAPYIENRYME